MNRKILTFLIVLIAVISIASVCAVELTKENDFDGKFKMNCTENVTFNVTDRYSPEFVSNQSWINDDESIHVCYYDAGMDNLIPIIKSNTLFTNEPKVEGNLTIFEDTTSPEGSSYAVKYFVGVSSPENKTVFVGCDDLDLAKQCINTIKFN
ncbi:hypothetical protein [Methanobrevibacter sp.]|uniref:hypothetical protein n=1 Tax=Methanobrevibacter sp. TaxID=66852 RepID=UPI0025D764EB|nr:hypothetical protein [uncultured Methanobrevibacter sp.]